MLIKFEVQTELSVIRIFRLLLERLEQITYAVRGEDSSEMPLREKLCYLCKNVLSNMHIYSDFESCAKVRISKPGQGIGRQKHCA